MYSLLAPGGVLLVNFCYAHIGDGEKSKLVAALHHVQGKYDVYCSAEDTICIRRTLEALVLPVNYTEGTISHVWKTVQAQYYVAHYELAEGVAQMTTSSPEGTTSSLQEHLFGVAPNACPSARVVKAPL